jgi:precorrin-2/cobalt-factor-2 C20-methyltransferase
MAGAQIVSGKLYGVGVGPGDPELMTVKAWRLVSTARVIAYLAANGGESTARAIARPFMPDDAEEIIVDVPMRIDPKAAQSAYDEGARQIAAQLSEGTDVVMLCEGDPFFYGSFIYIFERLAARFETIVVPGVTSFTAAAAASLAPLARRNDIVKVLPATLSPQRLEAELASSQASAIIKVGRHFGVVKDILERLGLSAHATVVEMATHRDERVRKLVDVQETSLPYFTTILVRREGAVH